MSAPLGYADKLVTIHPWLAIDSNRLPAIVCCVLAVTTFMVSSRNLVAAQETPVASVESSSTAGPVATTEAAPDYAGTLKPFLTTHCASCHLNGEAEAGIDLSRFEDAKSLLKDRLMWQRVVEVITAGTMPPEDAPKRPANEEVVAVCNALTQYYQFVDRTAKPDPGRVTMRRLNRVEYRNTVRDLFGLDFDPTEE